MLESLVHRSGRNVAVCYCQMRKKFPRGFFCLRKNGRRKFFRENRMCVLPIFGIFHVQKKRALGKRAESGNPRREWNDIFLNAFRKSRSGRFKNIALIKLARQWKRREQRNMRRRSMSTLAAKITRHPVAALVHQIFQFKRNWRADKMCVPKKCIFLHGILFPCLVDFEAKPPEFFPQDAKIKANEIIAKTIFFIFHLK